MFDVAAVSMLVFGAAGTFAPYIEVFNIVRFAQAMSTAGLQTLSAALCKSQFWSEMESRQSTLIKIHQSSVVIKHVSFRSQGPCLAVT